VNAYGATEVSGDATFQDTDVGFSAAGVRIGSPVANMRLCVLDDAGQVAPPSFVGELWITGPGLADGYLDRPDATTQAFVRDLNDRLEGCWYRTGDLVRV